MNFAYIIKSILIGEACKRPSWKGYVKKIAPTEGQKMSDGSTPVVYQLVFRQRDSDEFTYRVDAAGNVEFVSSSSSTETTLSFDGLLLASMMAQDWSSGKPEDFNEAASGTGVW